MKEILEGISKFVNECLGPLGSSDGSFYGWPDWIRDFLIQLAAFIILILVVRFFLWKPICKFLAAKQEATDQELESAKKIKADALKLQEEVQVKFDSASLEIKELLAKANIEGQRRKEEIVNEAKEEAKRRIEEADALIKSDIEKQKDDIKNEIVEIAFLAASKIALEEVDRKKYLGLVENIIESGLKQHE